MEERAIVAETAAMKEFVAAFKAWPMIPVSECLIW